ncbi:MAG: TIGR03663 family protein [Chloroflexi bacterium]|nr:TIGR03663 family protein [Chloroflexota bacterium]
MANALTTRVFVPSALKAWLYDLWRGGYASDSQAEEAEESRLATRWWELAGYGALLLTASVMRLWDLGARAMHHDESLHAFYSWNLFNGSGYVHNPLMHGPFQFEANAAVFFVFGDSDFTSRLLYAVLGIVLVGLPFLFRKRLGRLGALFAAGMLAFSPTMLYFSRFARNDILMAVWTLGLVISMWRYLDEGKNRYLYISAALLALAFATKETSYMVTAILGLFLTMMIVPRNLARLQQNIEIGEVSPPEAVWRWVKGIWAASRTQLNLSEVSRPAAFLILLITLTLPQWSAAVSILQNTPLFSWTNLVLASPETAPPIGSPVGGGMVIAFLITITMLGVSIYIGSKWKWSAWWRSALIFYVIWVLLYSTFFTNINGIGSGVWQSLGYWIVQQGQARGSQPWYYYFIISSIYEFLPAIFAIVAGVYYLRRRDIFDYFLLFWAVSTFVLYTIASEKMPWLLVNITLPLIIISAKFMGDMVERIEWRRLVSGGGVLLAPGVPLLLFLLWQLAFFEPSSDGGLNFVAPMALAIGALGLAALGYYLARRSGAENFAAFAVVPVVVILLALTIRASSMASYRNGDVPVEMLVYTQTSPDVARLIKEIKQAASKTGQNAAIPITVDNTSGFTWPWAWYLRNYTSISFPSFKDSPLQQTSDASILLIHRDNRIEAEEMLKEKYEEAQLIRHRWWFPESTYKNLTPGKFLGSFLDRTAWRRAMDYFLYREGVREQIGSEDSYLYVSQELPFEFEAVE